MEPLITNEEFSKAIGTEKFPAKSLNQMLSKMFKINEINKLYSDAFDLDTERFIENTLKNTNSHSKIIENIDVGGPTMVRSAAKNYKDVTVITSKDQYEELIKELLSFLLSL